MAGIHRHGFRRNYDWDQSAGQQCDQSGQLMGTTFRQEGGWSGYLHGSPGVGIVVGGDPNHVQLGQHSLQASSRFDTSKPRHLDIHDHDLGNQRQRQLKGGISIARFPDDREVAVPLQELPDRGAEQCRVVYKQDGKRYRAVNRCHIHRVTPQLSYPIFGVFNMDVCSKQDGPCGSPRLNGYRANLLGVGFEV